MDELKPCLCGSDKVHFGYEPFCGMTFWRVTCDTCGTQTSTFDTKEEAAKVWNTRPAEDALKAEVERLKSIIEESTKPRTGGIKAAVQTARKEVLFGADTNAPDMNAATKESEVKE